MESFYLTITRLRGVDYIEESPLTRATFETTVDGLEGGEIVGEVIAVLHIDPVAGTVRDFSVAVAQELSIRSRLAARPLPIQVVAMVAQHGFAGYEQDAEEAASSSDYNLRQAA